MAEPKHVELALGDGAEATWRFLHQEILRRFTHPSLRELEDSSLVELGGVKLAVTTDSFVVDPPIFPGGDIGRLAISGTVNDLLASGAKAMFLTLGLVLGEGFPYDHLHQILDSVASTAAEVDVNIIAGDTKVVPRAMGLGIHINTAGIGLPRHPGRSYRLANARSGDRILVSGFVADHAIAVLSQREGLGFEQRVSSDCAPLLNLILPLLDRLDGIRALRDPTRGGIAGVFHDLRDATGMEVHVNTAAVPVRPEVRFACEMLGFSPLDLANEGKMVIVIDPSQASAALDMLRSQPLGRDAAEIGHLETSQNGPAVVFLADNGNVRILSRSQQQLVPRLC